MHTRDLAPNIDPILRQYISLAIQETMAPALEELYTELSRTNARVSQAPDTKAIAADVATQVTSQLEQAVATRLKAAQSDLQGQLDDNARATGQALTRASGTLTGLRSLIDALDVKITKFNETERYEITRTHVKKILKELQK